MIIIQLALIIFGVVTIVIFKAMFEFDCEPAIEPIEPFRVSDYYDRLIKATEDIARDRASAKSEPIVLWLVLDGLQINEDGSLKWIHKDPPKKLDYICSHRSGDLMMLPTYADFYADNSCARMFVYNKGWRMCGTQRSNDYANAIEDLRTQLAYAMAQTSMSTAQAMQAMELMEARCNNECTSYWTF